jgi:hypothetical protein
MMELLKEGKGEARGKFADARNQQRARARRKRVECHCEVLVELAHHCVFRHDRQNSTIDSPDNPRHCEARSAVAIQKALQVALSFGVMEAPSGLPRRYAPRNDDGGESRGGGGIGAAFCSSQRQQDGEKRKSPHNAGRALRGL